MLSQYASPSYALGLLEAGSDGRAYLLKERVGDADDLVDAMRTVAAGGSVIDPKVVEELVNAPAADGVVTDRAAHPPREGDPGRDGPGQEQRGDRRRR